MKAKKPTKQAQAESIKKQIDDLRVKWDKFDNHPVGQQLITKQIVKLQKALKILTGETH